MAAKPAKLSTPFVDGKIKGMSGGGSDSDSKAPMSKMNNKMPMMKSGKK